VKWSKQYSNIEFISVLSREQSDAMVLDVSKLPEAKYIQHKVVEQHNDLDHFHVYACGSEQMIHDAKKLLIKHGLNSEKFYSDAFLPSN
jgi:CDP-4-dehydro-6-deoxyglucose reductase